MASIIKQVTVTTGVILEATNNIVVSASNIVAKTGKTTERAVDVIDSTIQVANMYSNNLKDTATAYIAESQFKREIRIKAMEAVAEDEDFQAKAVQAMKASMLNNLRESLDLE